MTKIDFEFVSTHRNRKLWANPCLFEVPYSGSGQKTGLNAVDAVSNQAPLVSWTGQVINIASVVVSAIDNTVVVSAAANSFSALDNFYQGAELKTPLGTSLRIDSNSFIAQSGGNDYVQFDVTGSGVKAGDAVTIQVTAVPNTLFVPNGSELANAYVGDYLYNETQGQWVLITGYDELLHKAIAPIPGGWAATDAYSIRRELPAVGNFAVGAGNTPTTLNLLGVGIVVEPGSFVRRLATGEIVSVASFDQLTGIAAVSPPTSTVLLAGEIVEVLSQSYDNYKTLSYAGTTVGQHEQVAYDINLVSCTVPNLEIINGEGGYPADYPFLYIELQDTNHPSQNNICSNAVSNKSYFKATTPTGQLLNRSEKFTKFTGDLSHKTVRFRPTSNFRIAWRLPSGEEIKFREQDAMSPTVPKAALQVSAHFNLERN
ncbi:hypothetical protein DH26_gp095 [Chloriridovirus anopheles1]|uniref:Uncharacterized protein n=1 Tax=Chloriridovirus anopheles1 TaxID=1465751 RepID=W8QN24_9VIRU|nr:hypothetical protein DH26_gp095 [Anopheles minimus iridovirus]AHL67588.1 hypothetical protein AMIV_095 [Anopheles minimus iridovirus]